MKVKTLVSSFSYALYTLSIVLVVVVVVRLIEWSLYWKRRGMKGPLALPLIGTLWEPFFTPMNILQEVHLYKYGRVVGKMVGWKPMVSIANADYIKQVLVTDNILFRGRHKVFPNDKILCKLLSETDGEEWKRLRDICSPAFTAGKLRVLEPFLHTCVKNTLKYIDSIEKIGSEFNVKRVMLSFTLDTIAKCAFGVDTNGFENPNEEFIVTAQEMVNIKFWRILANLLPGYIQVNFDLQITSRKMKDFMINTLKKIYHERKKLGSENKTRDFIQLMMEAEYKADGDSGHMGRSKLTEDEIYARCYDFFVAGYETTSSLLTFALYSLATNENIQENLYQEIKNCCEAKNEIDYECLSTLPYLDAVVHETLRMYPPIVFFDHVCSDEYRLGDIILEKGTIVEIPVYGVHHDPEYYPDPHKFDPRRFLPENKRNVKIGTFLGFGIGPRMCIGRRFGLLSAKLFLAHFTMQFKVMKTDKTPASPIFNTKYIFIGSKPTYLAIKRR